MTQVSAPWLEWNVCDLPSIECLSGFNVFATASDKKTVAAANGRSLLFFDASTLKIVAGPFELNQGEIEEINHLEFSPNDKFVFFGRLDKWFSVEKECVEDLPEFSKNSIIYEWGLFTPDGRCIVVKRNDFFHIPQTCQGKCCMVELLALWAVKEMDRSKDDERTCFLVRYEPPLVQLSRPREDQKNACLSDFKSTQICIRFAIRPFRTTLLVIFVVDSKT